MNNDMTATPDLFYPARLRAQGVSLAIASTTQACRAVAAAHQLAPLPTVALGRLLTSAVLMHLLPGRVGTFSLQVLGDGALRQLFADVDDTGRLRAYGKGRLSLGLPVTATTRTSTAAAVGQGMLSAVWARATGDHTQSATDLASGEVDEDVEHFATTSEQVPSVLVCDVVFDAAGGIVRAGGFLAQAMPDAEPGAIAAIRDAVTGDTFHRALATGDDTPAGLLTRLVANAEPVDGAVPLLWHCRCSDDRVLQALRLLGADALNDMLAQQEVAEVHCDFCSKVYRMAPEQVRMALETFH